jgi:hypothetical protein
MFDFNAYIKTFNSGDDKAMLDGFWVDDLEVWSGRRDQAQLLASGKADFLKFLDFAHDGVREIMRVQTLMQERDRIFAEIDMDFIASKDRPDYPFGHLKPGDRITVKMFCLYSLRGDRLASNSPARNFGPPPPL